MIQKLLLKQKRLLFSVLLSISVLYYISSCYINTSNDGSHFALVSAIINNGTLEVKDYLKYCNNTDYALKDGKYYSDRLPGNAFLMAPFFLYGKLLEKLNLKGLSSHPNIEEVTVILQSNLCAVAGIFFLFLIFRHFNFSFNLSLFASVIFAVCTLNWQESTHVFSHAASMCFVLMAFYFLISAKDIYGKGFLLFVFLLSFSSIIELQNLLLFFPAIVYILLSKKINFKLHSQNLKYIALGFLLFCGVLSALLIYNYAAFHELTFKSNKYNPEFPEEINFLSSLSGNFISGIDRLFTNFLNPQVYQWKYGVQNDVPGVLVTSPMLIFSLAGFVLFFKKHFNEALLFTLIILINIVIAALHKTVLTRHIFTITPFIFFPFVFVLEYIFNNKNSATKIFVGSLIILLSALSCARVFYVTHTYWGREITNIFPFAKEIWVYIVFVFLLSALIGIILFLKRKLNKNSQNIA